MKMLFSILLLVSFSAHSSDLCSRYEAGSDRAEALVALTKYMGRSLEEVCTSTRILDIEIQPSQVIIDGEIVPQWAIFLHYNEDSCKYMLNRTDFAVTSSKCFPTW